MIAYTEIRARRKSAGTHRVKTGLTCRKRFDGTKN
jgi:hypothetical protein